MNLCKFIKTKLINLMMISVLLLLLISGCGQQSTPEQDEQRSEKMQIGITFDSFIIERWQRDRDVFVSAAEELGAEVNVQNANGDIEEQIKQIDYFIEKGMDVIVVIQVADDTNTLNDAIDRAHKAGIPVISYDRLVMDANVDLYISFDNEKVGTLMGEHMRKHIGDNQTILQICGPLSDNNVPMIMKGFDGALSGANITVAQTSYAEGWLAETAFDVTSKYLSENEPPVGIMCGNDSLAGNAVRALSEARLAGEVCIVGQDADLDACQRIVEGTQCMTVYKPVEKLARRTAELAVELATTKKLEDITDTMNDGTYNVPYEALEPIAVEATNMDEIITGKYHEEADIYRNVR